MIRSLIAVLATFVAASEEHVAVLTESNFDEHLKSHPKTLVKFYAPWCGHCKKMAPEYEKAAGELEGKGVSLAKVDATVEKALGEKHNIKGYPTLMWFDNGEPQEYDGGRTSDTIVEWIEEMTGPAVKEVEMPLEPTSKPSVVLYADEISDVFEKVASGNRKKASFQFVKASNNTMTIRHNGEAPIEVTDAEVLGDAEKMKQVILDNSHPLFGELSGETYGDYMARGIGLVWSLFAMESSEEMMTVVDSHREVFTTVAKDFLGKYSFTYTDTVKFKSAVENMLGVSEFPSVVAFKKAGDKAKYVYSGEMTVDGLKAFFKGIEDGTIEPTLRSDEVPEDNSDPVKVIVGKTMEKELFTAEKDVLFEVYAPWCGHCKKLEPEYEKVAKKIRKEGLEDMVMLAKMDGTTNDSPVESISWDGFPTLYYIKAGTSEPMRYEGGRDAKGIWKWIKKNHSKADELAEKVKANKEVEKEDKDEL